MDIQKIWQSYRHSKSLELRKQLLIQYLGVVKYVAQHLYIPTASVLESDDVLHFGILGLNEAIDRFDPAIGVKFETYAIPRIKGMILDELRRVDTMPRSLRDQSKKALQTASQNEQRFGREVSSSEVAKAMKISEQEYSQLLGLLQATQLISLDEYITDEQSARHETIADATQNIEEQYEVEEQKQAMINALKQLPQRERLIMTLHYYEGATFDEIGKILGVSESRVSQIHSKVIQELRHILELVI